MIRDRLVVGLRDVKLSERLEMDATLSLEKAVNMARQSENVHKQQKVVRASNSVESKSGNVDVIRVPKFKKQEDKKVLQTSKYLEAARTTACSRCGNVFHNWNVCPAREVKCYQCSCVGHFAKMCQSKKVDELYDIESSDTEDDNPEIFLGEVSDSSKEPWEAEITINHKLVKFKLIVVRT